MGVHLRKKELKKGRYSYYLDFWPPVKDPDTGKETRREFLKIYPYVKANTKEKRELNKVMHLKAEKIKVERELEIFKGEYKRSPARLGKKNFIDFFEELVKGKKESITNRQNWESALSYLKAFAGDQYSMHNIDEDFCADFRSFLLETNQLRHKDRKLAQNSAASYFNKFRSGVKIAFEKNYLQYNPIKNVSRIKEENTKKEFLTKEELEKLWNTDCQVPLMKNIVFFMVYSGLRWGDASTLRWKDIQYSRDMGHFIHINEQKTKKEIFQHLSDQIGQVLPERGEPDDLVFEGLEYSQANNSKLQEWADRAKVYKKVRYHMMRHTHASLMYHETSDIFMVQERLGHRNVRTTADVYTKKSGQKRKEAANTIILNLKGTENG